MCEQLEINQTFFSIKKAIKKPFNDVFSNVVINNIDLLFEGQIQIEDIWID